MVKSFEEVTPEEVMVRNDAHKIKRFYLSKMKIKLFLRYILKGQLVGSVTFDVVSL